MSHNFEVDGTSFTLEPLGSEASLYGLGILMGAIGAIKGGGADQIGNALKQNADSWPKLSRLFKPACQVKLLQTSKGNGNFPLEQSAEQVFQGKPVRQLGWLIACCASEYQDFLSESGRAPLLALANELSFLRTLIGASGGSQPATNSDEPTP